ncbi:MAG: DUF6514 family protein [Defluviitaleaceae bacterium]|nr:DUF6514 family protein [Defluviitaleaceae bacterium]
MNEKVLVTKSELVDGMGIKWILEYYILIFDVGLGQRSYGIGIEGRSFNKDASEKSLSESTQGGITHSFDEAEEWVCKLAQGTAFPINLHEYVNDFIYEKENAG